MPEGLIAGMSNPRGGCEQRARSGLPRSRAKAASPAAAGMDAGAGGRREIGAALRAASLSGGTRVDRGRTPARSDVRGSSRIGEWNPAADGTRDGISRHLEAIMRFQCSMTSLVLPKRVAIRALAGKGASRAGSAKVSIAGTRNAGSEASTANSRPSSKRTTASAVHPVDTPVAHPRSGISTTGTTTHT